MTALVSQQILNVAYTTDQPLRVTSMAVEVLRSTATTAAVGGNKNKHLIIVASN